MARRARSRRVPSSTVRSPRLAVGSASTGRDLRAFRMSCCRAIWLVTLCSRRCRASWIRACSSAAVGHDPLGGVGGRRRAVVGHQIHDRVVRLMADRADHRRPAGRDRSHQGLVGERQQVLQRPATSGDHDHLDLRNTVQLAQPGDDLFDRLRALDQGVPDRQPDGRPAPAGVLDHVALGRAVRPVISPTRCGRNGSGRLRVESKSPSACSSLLVCSS